MIPQQKKDSAIRIGTRYFPRRRHPDLATSVGPQGKSVDPSLALPSCVDTDTKVGIRILPFITTSAAARCWIWDLNYVTALVNILGPVKRVAAVTTKAFEERVATSQAVRGLKIPVKITTHLAGTIEFPERCDYHDDYEFRYVSAQSPLHRNLRRDRFNESSRSERIWRSCPCLSSRRQLGRGRNPFPEQCPDDRCY